MIRKHIFEDLPQVSEIKIEIDFTYHHDQGRYSGPPENCWPPSEEAEITPPNGWEQIVIAKYLAAARLAIKQIETQCQVMEVDGTCREWAEGDGDDYDI